VGDVVRLHSEYQNGTGATVPDVMGIMTLWVASRPQGASPLKVSLVPALRQTISGTQCQARGGTSSSHGPPLSFTSCNPPTFVPGTIGWVGDQSRGSATVVAVPGDTGTPANDADLVFYGQTTDIRAGGSAGADYAPSPTGPDMTLVTKLRISDSYNGASQTDTATVADFDFAVPVDCVPTPDPAVGSTCATDTTANALNPGAVREGKAASYQVFRVRLNDSGSNGVRGDGDDRIVEQQGIYIP
jgi:hypothetical protein